MFKRDHEKIKVIPIDDDSGDEAPRSNPNKKLKIDKQFSKQSKQSSKSEIQVHDSPKT